MTNVMESVKTYQQFIGGKWVDSASGAQLPVENPADGTVIASVPASDEEDVDRALGGFDFADLVLGADAVGVLEVVPEAGDARRGGALGSDAHEYEV